MDFGTQHGQQLVGGGGSNSDRTATVDKAVTIGTYPLGNTIYCLDRCTQEVILHEMVHVQQFPQGGAGFAIVYGWEAAFGGTRCGNKYERSAYKVSLGPC